MEGWTPNQLAILALTFIVGLVLGMILLAGRGRGWRTRYAAEAERRAELERENERLLHSDREKDSLRRAAARDEVRRRDVGERDPL
jgi:hypothetical protein